MGLKKPEVVGTHFQELRNLFPETWTHVENMDWTTIKAKITELTNLQFNSREETEESLMTLVNAGVYSVTGGGFQLRRGY